MSQLRALLRFLTLSVIILGGLHGLVITFPLVFSENVRGAVTLVLWGCMLSGLFVRYDRRLNLLAPPKPLSTIVLGASHPSSVDFTTWDRLQVRCRFFGARWPSFSDAPVTNTRRVTRRTLVWARHASLAFSRTRHWSWVSTLALSEYCILSVSYIVAAISH